MKMRHSAGWAAIAALLAANLFINSSEPKAVAEAPPAQPQLTAALGGCQSDLDGDGEVGIADFLMLLADWGPCGLPTGACCFGDGICTQETEPDCKGAGGDFQGDGIDCDSANCPQPSGACCFGDGTCTEQMPADCISAGGAYQGDATDCDPNPCPQTGACCFPDGTCCMQADCEAAGGTYQGDGTDCDPNFCPLVDHRYPLHFAGLVASHRQARRDRRILDGSRPG